MKRLFFFCLAFLLCLGIMFYKPAPTYNPFDDVFDIDVNQLHDYDTLIVGCGDCIFQKRTTKRLKHYYQIFCEDMNEVVNKGFYYHEDTILYLSDYASNSYSDSVKNLPLNIKEFNKALSEFGYCYLDKDSTDIRIIHKTNLDTITTSLSWYELENDSTKIVRTIYYYKSTPKITRNSDNEFIIY